MTAIAQIKAERAESGGEEMHEMLSTPGQVGMDGMGTSPALSVRGGPNETAVDLEANTPDPNPYARPETRDSELEVGMSPWSGVSAADSMDSPRGRASGLDIHPASPQSPPGITIMAPSGLGVQSSDMRHRDPPQEARSITPEPIGTAIFMPAPVTNGPRYAAGTSQPGRFVLSLDELRGNSSAVDSRDGLHALSSTTADSSGYSQPGRAPPQHYQAYKRPQPPGSLPGQAF